MEQSGFWNFFFATGLPQAYLAARLKEGEEVNLIRNFGYRDE